jgi:hypothetical protein
MGDEGDDPMPLNKAGAYARDKQDEEILVSRTK